LHTQMEASKHFCSDDLFSQCMNLSGRFGVGDCESRQSSTSATPCRGGALSDRRRTGLRNSSMI
ncbi:MAG: hypothetical protein WBF17_23505, partial [Phycisphaerae bacterium]